MSTTRRLASFVRHCALLDVTSKQLSVGLSDLLSIGRLLEGSFSSLGTHGQITKLVHKNLGFSLDGDGTIFCIDIVPCIIVGLGGVLSEGEWQSMKQRITGELRNNYAQSMIAAQTIITAGAAGAVASTSTQQLAAYITEDRLSDLAAKFSAMTMTELVSTACRLEIKLESMKYQRRGLQQELRLH